MAGQLTVEEIREQMNRIRAQIDDDAEGLRVNALQVLDWKYYVRRHPVASLAAVATVGYFLVPKSSPPIEKKVYLDPETSRSLLQEKGSVQLEDAESAGAKGGLLMSLGALALNSALRIGMAYAGQRMRDALQSDFRTGPAKN